MRYGNEMAEIWFFYFYSKYGPLKVGTDLAIRAKLSIFCTTIVKLRSSNNSSVLNISASLSPIVRQAPR